MSQCLQHIKIAAHLHTHWQFRGIEWKGIITYDLKKVTFSTLFKLYIAGLGCADFEKVSYVGAGPSKVGQEGAKLPLASAK